MLDKIKSLSKQTLIYGTSTIIGRFLNFLLVPLYTNIFPPSEYGIVTLVFAYIAMLNIFYSIGMESGYFKFASTLEVGDEKQNFTHPYVTVFLNALVLSTVILILSDTLTGIISLNSQYSSFVRYSALILFFDAIVLVPFAHLRLKNKASRFAAIKITNIAVNVVLNILLVVVLRMGLIAIFISNLAASFVTFLLLIPVVYKNLSFTFNSKLLDELWRFSLPYVPSGLASNMIIVISRPIMQYLTDDATIGIFRANLSLAIFMSLIVQMFEYAWRPFFLQNANEPNAKQLFSKIMTVFVGFASLILIIITFFVDNIIKIPLPFRGHLIGVKYWGGVYIVPIILFAYLFNGIYINLMVGIYVEKKTKYLPFITGLGAVITIALNFILIPIWGLTGAALATLFSYLSMAIYLYAVSQKFYPIKYEMKKICLMCLINISALLIYYAMYYNQIPSNLILKIIFSIGLMALVAVISGISKAKRLLFSSPVQQ
jgi:O-antigen/teichoic acid export membrane protein